MARLPILSSRELTRILIKEGFEYAPKRGKGSHTAFVKRGGDKTRLVIVPDRKEIPRGTLIAILDQAGLSKERLFELVRKK
jgi:predicted RNA binding protein YcfA (HicA-like mRNA interferase family)